MVAQLEYLSLEYVKVDYKIVKCWSDKLIVQVESGKYQGLSAIINGEPYECAKSVESNEERWEAKFDFLSHLVETFLLVDYMGVQIQDSNGMSQLLFSHDPDSIARKIQMRELEIANGFRYLCSIQGYLWCKKNEDILGRDQFLKLSSYCLCCSIYRLMQFGF